MLAAVMLAAVFPAAVAAHGNAPVPAPLWDVVLAWSIEAHVLLPLLAAALVYRWAAGVVAQAHSRNPMPRWRARGRGLGVVRGTVGAARGAGLADRHVRHDALLCPHGPAPAADHGRRAAAGSGRSDHATAARLVARGAPADLAAAAPFAGAPGGVLPGL